MIYKRTINDSVYGCQINLMICEFSELRDFFMESFGVETKSECPNARVIEHSYQVGNKTIRDWYFWVPPWPKRLSVANYGTLAHECFHVTAQILRSRGIKLVEESEEAFAYYLSNVFGEILGGINGYGDWYQRQADNRKRLRKRRRSRSHSARLH